MYSAESLYPQQSTLLIVDEVQTGCGSTGKFWWVVSIVLYASVILWSLSLIAGQVSPVVLLPVSILIKL